MKYIQFCTTQLDHSTHCLFHIWFLNLGVYFLSFFVRWFVDQSIKNEHWLDVYKTISQPVGNLIRTKINIVILDIRFIAFDGFSRI